MNISKKAQDFQRRQPSKHLYRILVFAVGDEEKILSKYIELVETK